MKNLLALFLAVLLCMVPSNTNSTEAVTGWASNYAGTAGFMGQATVALPSFLGGRYTGNVNGLVRVCADRCAELPAVDFCLCHVEPSLHPDRVVDLSWSAWALVSDYPLSEGLIQVTVQVLDSQRTIMLPNTAME